MKMIDKIIEILKRNLQLDMPNPEEAEIETAEEISAAFEERLREELIKYTDKMFTDIIGDGTIFVDEYLKTR